MYRVKRYASSAAMGAGRRQGGNRSRSATVSRARRWKSGAIRFDWLEAAGGHMEDAEDYQAFEAAITADYDAQSAVERELVLRLASLLWRLRRATMMETGLFEIQAEYLRDDQPTPRLLTHSQNLVSRQPAELNGGMKPGHLTVEFARCFLRLANLPNFALDRLSRYEATLWRQVGQILFALDALDRRKPQERGRRSATTAHRFGLNMDFANYRAGASSLADDF